jgi:hypothetical protein
MGVLKIVDDSPSFATGQPLSAEMLGLLRDNALAISEASYLGVTAHFDRYQVPPEDNSTNPVTVWRGGFVFLTGMDTLRIVTFTSGQQAGDVLRVYQGDDTALSDDLTLADGLQTHTITIDADGHAHGEVVLLRLDLYNATAGATYDWGNIDIREVVVYPVDLSDAFPGVPTFGAISAANLNQLSNAIDWLARRMGLRYEPLMQAVIRRLGPWFDAVDGTQADVRLTGSVRKSPAQAELVARGLVYVAYGATESIRLNISGGAVEDTYTPPTTPGIYSWELIADISGSATDALIPWIVDYIRTGGSTSPQTVNRWSVYEVLTRPTTGAPASLDEPLARVPGTFSDLQTWLNALCTIVDAAYDRIVANYPVWQGQRAYRARYGIGDGQFKMFEPAHVALAQRRTGEALYVRGKGVTLGYGSGRFDEKEDKDTGFYAFENFRRETLLPGDQLQTIRFHLDTAPGLPAGAPFNLRGVDLFAAFEQLAVRES